MNSSGRMDKRTFTFLLIFCCFTFVCIHGKGQGPPPSCEVVLMVRRGTILRVGPESSLTVRCPVKHCGESLSVTWCKLLDTGDCEAISPTENGEISLTEKPVGDTLISFLTLTRISIHDGGLYRCSLKGYGTELISHSINVSVSESNKGVKLSEYDTDGLPNAAGNKDTPWLPYLAICLTVVLLVATLTVITLVCFYVRGRMLTYNQTKGQEAFHNLPDLPNGSAPSPFFLQPRRSFMNDSDSPSTKERPLPCPLPMTSENHPVVANPADDSQESDCAVYAVVSHRQPGLPPREQHASVHQNKKTEYASITVS